MVLDNAANFAESDVTSAINAGDTTVNVSDASVYPAAPFNVVVWDAATGTVLDDSNREVMRVTAVDTGTNTLTVTRAQEETSDVSHPDTSRVANRPTAKMFDDMDVSLEEIADYTASPTEVTAPVNNGSVTTDDSITVTTGEATDTLHYGSNQDRANAGDSGVAVGIGARVPTENSVSVGFQAAQNNTGGRVTAAGYRAARNNTGGGVTAAGYQAAQNNTGFGVTAAGYQAAQNNTGGSVTAAGYLAARNNTGFGVTVAGYQAAWGDGLADPTTMGDDNIGLGESAIRNNQASGLIAIGQDAGINAQTDDQLIITQRDGTRRMVMDLTTGDLSITGTLTENATL